MTEDISPTLSMYGDSTANTPHLDRLANVSTVYHNAFAPVPVCAPTRSSIITGMHPISIGTMHMRTAKDVVSWGTQKYSSVTNNKDINGESLQEYSAVVPNGIKCFTEYLRSIGYYCSNNVKTDYQFAAPFTAWDDNSDKAHWRNREKGQPFFSVININDTHESKLWAHNHLPLSVDTKSISVPSIFPDDSIVRKDLARNYSNIELMDSKVGEIIKQLKEEGLYENTIIFFYSDHGGPLPNQKREVNDRGLKIPLMVKWISQNHRKDNYDMISLVDLAPTVLSIAGIKPKSYIQGHAFLGKYKDKKQDFIYASGDRFDEHTDRSRAIRDKRYLLVINFYPQKPHYKEVAYRKSIPLMNHLLEKYRNGSLSNIQRQWFESKDSIELYDTVKDPLNIYNLANDANHEKIKRKLLKKLNAFIKKSNDLGLIPEKELILSMWPNGIQPITENPHIYVVDNLIYLKTPSYESSIAYYFADHLDDNNPHWQLYTKPQPMRKNLTLFWKAIRIGFKESELSKQTL